MMKNIYSFGNGKADGDASMRTVLGGKGAGERFYNNQVAVRGGVHEDFSFGTISKFFIFLQFHTSI